MNEETVDEVLSLFRKAEADIEIASDMMPKVDGRQHDNIGQHLRQAIEAVAKAIVLAGGALNIPRSGKEGHDVAMLFRMAEDVGSQVTGNFAELIGLRIYDSNSRYEFILAEMRLDLRRLLHRVTEFHQAAIGEIQRR